MESEMDLQRERAAFEAVTNTYHCIYNADLNYYFSGSKFTGDKVEIEVNAGWKAWQTAKSQAIPEGCVVVPKEPTEAMLFAASGRDIVAEHYGGENILWSELRETWKVMLEAVQEKNNESN